MSELKPCPFCGCAEIKISGSIHETYARCSGCGAEHFSSEWNKRPHLDALRARLEAAEAVVEAARHVCKTLPAAPPRYVPKAHAVAVVETVGAIAGYDRLSQGSANRCPKCQNVGTITRSGVEQCDSCGFPAPLLREETNDGTR